MLKNRFFNTATLVSFAALCTALHTCTGEAHSTPSEQQVKHTRQSILQQAKKSADGIADTVAIQPTDLIIVRCHEGGSNRLDFLYALLPANQIYDTIFEPIITSKTVAMQKCPYYPNGRQIIDITTVVRGYRKLYKAATE